MIGSAVKFLNIHMCDRMYLDDSKERIFHATLLNNDRINHKNITSFKLRGKL